MARAISSEAAERAIFTAKEIRKVGEPGSFTLVPMTVKGIMMGSSPSTEPNRYFPKSVYAAPR